MKDLDFVGQTLDGKYQMTRELGRGGMGTVYLATHLGTERPVAVKIIAPQFMQRTEFVERFVSLHHVLKITCERRAARQHLVRDDAEAVYVRTRIEVFASALLGRHIKRRAQNGPDTRQLGRIL